MPTSCRQNGSLLITLRIVFPNKIKSLGTNRYIKHIHNKQLNAQLSDIKWDFLYCIKNYAEAINVFVCGVNNLIDKNTHFKETMKNIALNNQWNYQFS